MNHPTTIREFKGKYFFLSNFYLTPVKWDGLEYTNNEAAFQSAKVKDKLKRKGFIYLPPSQAKSKGRQVELRWDWQDVKEDIMYQICKAKFTQNPYLRDRLLETGHVYLQEGNNWGDKIWGTVNGVGENLLGKILMRVRDELRNGGI